jgi:hypothetical protein
MGWRCLASDIRAKGFTALVEGLSCYLTLLEMDMEMASNRAIPASLVPRIYGCFTANRFLHRYRYRSREQEPAPISTFIMSHILARVSSHPAVLYLFVRVHIPALLASLE